MNEDATKNNMKVVSLKFSSISRISLTQTFFYSSIFGLEMCAGKDIYRFMFLQWMVQEKGRGSSISGNLWISYEERWRGDRFLHNALRAGSKWHRQGVTRCKTLHESSCHLTSPSTTLWWWPWSTSVAVTQLFNGSSLLPKDCLLPEDCGHCVWQILGEEWIARSDCNGIVTGCLLFWRRLKLYFCGKRPKLAQRLTLRKRPVTEKMKKRWLNPEVL